MSSKILIIIGSAAMLTSCVSHLHNHRILENNNVIIVVEKEKPTTLSIETLVQAVDFEKIKELTDEILSEKEISYVTYFYTEKVFIKREKPFLLLNNKSRYNDKSPVLNKSDSDSNRKLNIIVVCALLVNHERPHIRSPGYSI
jgi:hypothetical protein